MRSLPRVVGNAHVTVADELPSSAVHDAVFEALADPHRRAILLRLRDGERSVRELADTLPISRPAVSRHLRLLSGAGLVTSEPRGTRRLYRLHDEGVEAVRAYLEDVWGDAARRFTLAAENTER
jgi:DNA-binding transcriptional ArsR family regulator